MITFDQETVYQDMDYQALFDTCRDCQLCPLKEERTQVVVGHGPVPCELMIVGEGPGKQEDEEGKPFVGRSGQLLTKILESIGLNREEEVYIANTVKCRPPKNRDPKPEEIEACKPYLIRQVQLVQPRILLLLGAPSLKTILGDHLTITKARGQWFQAEVNYMEEPLYIMPLFHPAYLLRNQSKDKGSPKWLTWQDMQEVKVARNFYKPA